MEILATIAERKIRESMERGEFEDLAGKGKPQAMDEDLSCVPR
ncbi:DnaJ family domain-containing protein [Geotalea sp. SG265]|nr:DnaJ family domain-containing protein [Geotalea sp. SG265]